MRRFCVLCGERPSRVNQLLCLICSQRVEELVRKIAEPVIGPGR